MIDPGTRTEIQMLCLGSAGMRLVGWAGRREDVQVVDVSADSLRAELALLAARFGLSGVGPDVNRAIRVACDLLARELDTPATVGVAALAYGTPLRHAGPVIRDMLREQGFPRPGLRPATPGSSSRCCRRRSWRDGDR